MKLLLFVTAVAAVFSSAICLGGEQNSLQGIIKSQRQKQQMRQISTKIETICPGYGDRMLEALQEVQSCAAQQVEFQNETVCSLIKNHFMRCSKPVLTVLEECLPQKSKDLPQFIFDAVARGSEYLCKTDGEHIFELSNPCLYSITAKTQRCIRRIETKLDEYSSSKPTKAEVCSLSASMKGCFQSHILSACGSSVTQESFLRFYDAVTAGCNSMTFSETNDLVDV